MLRVEYFNWLATFGKSYASLDHFDHGFDNFSTNLAIIEAHNLGDVPFTMALNSFSDLNEQEFLASVSGVKRGKKLQGSKLKPITPDNNKVDVVIDVPISIPEFKNWFEEGKVTKPIN